MIWPLSKLLRSLRFSIFPVTNTSTSRAKCSLAAKYILASGRCPFSELMLFTSPVSGYHAIVVGGGVADDNITLWIATTRGRTFALKLDPPTGKHAVNPPYQEGELVHPFPEVPCDLSPKRTRGHGCSPQRQIGPLMPCYNDSIIEPPPMHTVSTLIRGPPLQRRSSPRLRWLGMCGSEK